MAVHACAERATETGEGRGERYGEMAAASQHYSIHIFYYLPSAAAKPNTFIWIVRS